MRFTALVEYVYSKVVEVGTCIVCESNRKKTALIRAVSRH